MKFLSNCLFINDFSSPLLIKLSLAGYEILGWKFFSLRMWNICFHSVLVVGFLFSFLIFYCILGFGIHVQNMQDSCIGTQMAVGFASFLPFTHIWHFSPGYPSPPPPLHWPSPFPPSRLQCLVLPSLCPCVPIFHHLPMIENIRYFIFFSCVSLLRMMFSRFIHVPTKDMNSSFWLLHNIPRYICATFSLSSLSSMGIWVGSRSLLL